MRTGRKIWKIMIAALLLVPLFAGGLSAFAETETSPPTVETANVTLHKRVFKDKLDTGYPKENTGLEDENFGGMPLAGAGFTVYNVTDAYHAALVGKTQAEAIAAVLALHEATPPTVFPIAKEEQLTMDPGGKTTFTGLSLKSGDKDAAYLFVETMTPDSPTIVEKAAPFILAMPIYTAKDKTGELNKDIHVYPKNISAENKKEMTNAQNFGEVVINGIKHPNVQIGDVLNYKLTIQIPTNIGTRTSFVINDTPGAGMAVANPHNLKLVNGVTNAVLPASAYTVTPATPTSDITITLTIGDPAINALAGKKLIITYDMVLTKDAVPDTVIKNNASVSVNNKPAVSITPPPGVITGGKQFVKKDGHTEKALANAKFKVYKETEGVKEWATFTVNGASENAFAGWVATEELATEVTSGADGVIKVTGLSEGTYYLKETVTPDGYVLLAEPVEFEVAHQGYGSTDGPEGLRRTVNNVPKGLLPSTGGTGIYAFLAIGSMMMMGAYIWFKRSKEQAEV